MDRRKTLSCLAVLAVALAGCTGTSAADSVWPDAPGAVAASAVMRYEGPAEAPTITEVPLVVSDGVLAAIGDDAPADDSAAEVVPDVLEAEPSEAATTPADGAPVELDTLDQEERASGPVIVNESEFQTVAATWPEGIEDPPALQARVRSVDGLWGDWFPLDADDAAPDAGTADDRGETRAGTHVVHVGDADAVQVATAGTAAEMLVDDVLLTLIGSPESVPGGPAQEVGFRSEAASFVPTVLTAAAGATPPTMVTRAQWGAAAPTCAMTSAPRLLGGVVHHTATSNAYTTQAQAMQQIRNAQAYHMSSRGWCDLGYNFIVDRFGTLYEGRAGSMAGNVIGVHAGGFNTGTVGVAVLGTFSTTQIPQAAVQTMGRILGWRLGQSGVNPTSTISFTTLGGENSRFPAGATVSLPAIFAHRDVAYTECPGNAAFPQMGAIRAAAASGVGNRSPFGHLDIVDRAGAGMIRVRGWTVDPDAAAPIQVHVRINGVLVTAARAGDVRPDVERIHGHALAGFDLRVPSSSEANEVCVYMINEPAGANPLLGCRSVSLANQAPVGVLDVAAPSGPGAAMVRGWAFDPDSSESVTVHVRIDGRLAGSYRADAHRPDVGRVHNVGDNHGFSATVPAPNGTSSVCVYAINTPAGSNPLIGCRDVTVRNQTPRGSLDIVNATDPRQVQVRGWAFDADVASPITVRILVDGVTVASAPAAGARPDVARVHGVQEATGFDTKISLIAGSRTVCVEALDATTQLPTPIACRTVEVPNSAPLGALMHTSASLGVNGPARLQASGWAWDRDTGTGPVTVQLMVDGVSVGQTAASTVLEETPRGADRRDVGWSLAATALPGTRRVCAAALDAPAGVPLTLGCADVVVPNADPIGSVDLAVAAPGGIRVRGWVLDWDTPASLTVHIRVDGVIAGAATANGSRPDVERVFGHGAARGFDFVVPASSGTHEVCTWAINQPAGDNPRIACSTVTVP